MLLLLFATFGFVFVFDEAHAKPLVVAASTNMTCIDLDTATMAATGWKADNASLDQRNLIARVISSMTKNSTNQQLIGAINQIKFVVTSGSIQANTAAGSAEAAAKANSKTKTITLRADGFKSSALMTGYIAHEICHIVGGSTQQSSYSSYNRQVGESRCAISTYATNSFSPTGQVLSSTSRSEEFAEACSAFVVAPNSLDSAGPECKKAKSFVQASVFGRSPRDCNGFNSKNYFKPLSGPAIQTNTAPPSSMLLSTFQLLANEINEAKEGAGVDGGLASMYQLTRDEARDHSEVEGGPLQPDAEGSSDADAERNNVIKD